MSNNPSKNQTRKSVVKTRPNKGVSAEPPAGYRVGYARVSTHDQELNLQLDALKAAGCSTIYEEKASGRSIDRPELANCLKALRPGDTLVVWRLDRLGRSISDLVTIVDGLGLRGIQFESLTEKIETASPAGMMIFVVFAALASYERNIIKERTLAGLAAAKLRGRVGGRQSKLNAKQKSQMKTLIESGTPVNEVAKTFGLSRSTVYNYINEFLHPQQGEM